MQGKAQQGQIPQRNFQVGGTGPRPGNIDPRHSPVAPQKMMQRQFDLANWLEMFSRIRRQEPPDEQ